MAITMIDRREAIRRMADGGMSLPVLAAFGQIFAVSGTVVTAASIGGSPTIDLGDAGVRPGRDPRVNLRNFQRAIDLAPTGSTLLLPRSEEGACQLDTSGGWSRCVQINKRLTLRIDGDLQATHSAMRPAPPYLVNISAPGVRIEGTGRFVGDGQIDDTNAGTDEVFPGLIRVAADDFFLTGVEFVSAPKVGLMLYQCRRAQIRNARFTGGPVAYRDTGHFAIRANGGGDHVIAENRFYPDARGGMAVQCIMLVGSHRNMIAHNHALHPYEKLLYCYGDHNIARDNMIEGNRGLIPGLNIEGTYTSVIRFHGSHNRVERNKTTHCAGGVQMMDGSGHVVIDNQFLGCGQSAITAYDSDLDQSIFSGNTCTRLALAGFVGGSGIYLVSNKGGRMGPTVERNVVRGFSTVDPIGSISQWRSGTRYGLHNIVKPSVGNGRFYVVSAPGVAGSREPRWVATPGEAMRDNGVTWKAVAFEGGQAEIALFGGTPDRPLTGGLIRANETSGGRVGIAVKYGRGVQVVGNRIDASIRAMVDVAGLGNAWEGNTVIGAGAKIVGDVFPLGPR